MFFRNLQIYRLSTEWPITDESLSEQLLKRQFTPCGNQDMERSGWVVPFDGADFVHVVGGQWLICLQHEMKILPASVVKDEAAERAKEIEQKNGFKIGRKMMKELRELVATELMPRAFTRRRRTFAWIDPVGGWLVVDAPSQARAEDALEQLRHALDTFPLTLLRTERSPASAMADWLAGSEAPAGFTIDQDCMLTAVTEDRAKVTYAHHPLEGDEIKSHLEGGKLPTRLALTYNDRVSFVLTEKLEIKRIDFLDVVRDQIDGSAEDAEALFNAEFALMTGELGLLILAVVEALGGELKREPDLIDRAREAA